MDLAEVGDPCASSGVVEHWWNPTFQLLLSLSQGTKLRTTTATNEQAVTRRWPIGRPTSSGCFEDVRFLLKASTLRRCIVVGMRSTPLVVSASSSQVYSMRAQHAVGRGTFVSSLTPPILQMWLLCVSTFDLVEHLISCEALTAQPLVRGILVAPEWAGCPAVVAATFLDPCRPIFTSPHTFKFTRGYSARYCGGGGVETPCPTPPKEVSFSR